MLQDSLKKFDEKFPTDIHKVWSDDKEFLGSAYSVPIKDEIKQFWIEEIKEILEAEKKLQTSQIINLNK